MPDPQPYQGDQKIIYLINYLELLYIFNILYIYIQTFPLYLYNVYLWIYASSATLSRGPTPINLAKIYIKV